MLNDGMFFYLLLIHCMQIKIKFERNVHKDMLELVSQDKTKWDLVIHGFNIYEFKINKEKHKYVINVQTNKDITIVVDDCDDLYYKSSNIIFFITLSSVSNEDKAFVSDFLKFKRYSSGKYTLMMIDKSTISFLLNTFYLFKHRVKVRRSSFPTSNLIHFCNTSDYFIHKDYVRYIKKIIMYLYPKCGISDIEINFLKGGFLRNDELNFQEIEINDTAVLHRMNIELEKFISDKCHLERKMEKLFLKKD